MVADQSDLFISNAEDIIGREQGNPLLSGRGKRVVDGLFGENMVALRPHPESESDRKTWRRSGDVRHQSARTFVVSPAQQTDRIAGSDRFS